MSTKKCENYKKHFQTSPPSTESIDAELGEFPHTVALAYYNEKVEAYKFRCGGALISSKYLVAPAHCVNVKDQKLKLARIGSVSVPVGIKTPDSQLDHNIAKISVHPNYNKGTYTNDIAVIELEKEVNFSDHIRPACLNTETGHEEVVLTEWGKDESLTKVILHKLKLSPISHQECNKQYTEKFKRPIADSEMCAAHNRNDTCRGDLQGPLQVPNGKLFTLVALPSYGPGCGVDFPALYTKIYNYLEWIESIIMAQLQEGLRCKTSNLDGICTLEPDCPQATNSIQQYGHHDLTRCGFQNFTEIVCCPGSHLPFVETTTSKPIRKSIQACEEYKAVVTPLSILGGGRASSKEYPHMAALGFYSEERKVYEFSCGGTLISNKFVITAAHCIVNIERNELKIVRIGEVHVPSEITTADLMDRHVKRSIVHPAFKRKGNINDIALAELEKTVYFTRYAKPACLHSGEDEPENLEVIGWGKLGPTGNRSPVLQKAKIKLASFKKCAQSYRAKYGVTLNNRQICATSNKSDTCEGDSGGPLQIKQGKLYVLIGITSFGEECGGNLPGIYTKIHSYLDWIESIVWA
ncbi:Trypsin domain containing protein [Asbolus verrucosus]|uniref:Trypsin domain containing protein n=1 Tax=Asbolus verrucosus TaxID=1661398 RepID=A0A482W960_ASBVE|nr:Trypsin domain containing protein [Asbolus verrucosus]